MDSYRKRMTEKWKKEGRCVYCAGINDRAPKVLCTKCATVHLARTKAVQLKIKIAAFNAYGGCFCKCCGESNLVMLTIDHMNGDGADHRKQLRGGKGDSGGRGNKTYHWLKTHGYPPGYRVLCFNCNHAYHVLGKCPHEQYLDVGVCWDGTRIPRLYPAALMM